MKRRALGACRGICKDKQNSMGKAKSFAIRDVRNGVNDKRTKYGVSLWHEAQQETFNPQSHIVLVTRPEEKGLQI